MGVGGRTSGHNYGSSISPRYTPYSTAEYAETAKKLPPNPDPYNFRVIMEKTVGTYLVAWILYPDATNYEGLKIVLLKDTQTVKNQKSIDPHFFEGGNLVARFVPDQDGWELAIRVAQLMLPIDFKD